MNEYNTGLSPRVWGTQRELWYQRGNVRFIPTSVGNTALPDTSESLYTVYPHECGEHASPKTTAEPYIGLSPRVWGTRWLPGRAPRL